MSSSSSSSSVFFSLGPDASDTAAIGKIRDHFNARQPRFAYEGVAGRGVFGTTYRVRETLPGTGATGAGKPLTRRLAVKRAAEREEEALRNEIRWLKKLKGSEHIVRLVASKDDDEEEEEKEEEQGPIARLAQELSSLLVSNDNNRGNDKVKDSLAGLEGLVLVIEYLANGDLAQMHSRTIKYDLVVPNRVLWSILLCLVRACIAMAYPRNANENAEEPCRLEEIPGDGTPPSNLEHGDLHMGNIMMGDFASPSSGAGAHGLMPVLKLIDFGMAKENKDAVQENLFSISRVSLPPSPFSHEPLSPQQTILTQIPGNDQPHRAQSSPYRYRHADHRVQRLPHMGDRDPAAAAAAADRESFPLPVGYKYATLDQELRDLIARCLAQDPSRRPSLAEMLYEVQAAAVDRSAATAGDEDVVETDDAVHAFLQKALYDADDDAPGKEEAREDSFGYDGDFVF
ncbi:hypothetical protein PG997_006404 [Apiospora hydei]|uniref:non-specific serine/threonine protein kinase n=1 Tax=Apiospora hydei TaxID=1337664 RepID=A0ABR1WNY2_9PEZI